jgi:hypothetical protein
LCKNNFQDSRVIVTRFFVDQLHFAIDAHSSALVRYRSIRDRDRAVNHLMLDHRDSSAACRSTRRNSL